MASVDQAEAVPFEKIPFIDNKPLIELLNAKPYALPSLPPLATRHPLHHTPPH